jgi:threonine/homoserine/homoserine lactone efflux protein
MIGQGNAEILSTLSSGVVLGLSAGLSPGPLQTLVLAQSMRHGTREGLKVALVPFLTDVPVILVCILVLKRLTQFGPVLGTVSLVGTAFVLWLAYESLSVRGMEMADPDTDPKSMRRGLLVNFLNPNVYVFWLTVGGPIILKAWAQTPLAAAGFLACLLGCLVGCKMTLAVIVGRSRHLLAGGAYIVVMRILGVLLLLFAMMMFRDGLRLLGFW